MSLKYFSPLVIIVNIILNYTLKQVNEQNKPALVRKFIINPLKLGFESNNGGTKLTCIKADPNPRAI